MTDFHFTAARAWLRVASSGATILAIALVWALSSPAPAAAANDFSAAEQAIFIDNQMAALRPPANLRYAYRKTGSLEEPFDDNVDVVLVAQPDGSCCAASAKFFSGARQVPQPEVEGVQGNPAIFYFLERDIKEMERLTKGKANYFRKRIRMAVYQSAVIRYITLPYRGQNVAVREISISPYLDDPNRSRYEKLANKNYVFLMAKAVPGGLYGIRTRIEAGSATQPPLMAEEMLLQGIEPAPARRQP